MKQGKHLTAFYLETLLLIVVLTAIILVLTQVFGMAQRQSAAAKELTDAVILAQNAAEAVSAGEDRDALLLLLNENGNAFVMQDEAGVSACYDRDRNPAPDGPVRVDVFWNPEKTEKGTMVHSEIQVYCGNRPESIYRLETAAFKPEARP